MRHEMNRNQSKDGNIRTYRIRNISLSCSYNKNIYLKMDILGYQTFINLFVNHTKTTLLNIDNLFKFLV